MSNSLTFRIDGPNTSSGAFGSSRPCGSRAVDRVVSVGTPNFATLISSHLDGIDKHGAFSTVRSLGFSSFAAVGLLMVVGCGEDDLGKRYPVRGTVKYKGEPLATGTITFGAEKGERGSSGPIKNGEYVLTAVTEGDGAFPGSYTVTIESLDIDLAKVEAGARELAKKHNIPYNESMIDAQQLKKAREEAKSNIPKKYSKADTSGLKAKVKAESNNIPFDLTD